jgi:hypothetical protein
VTIRIIDEVRAQLDELERALDAAASIQWERSPAPPASRDDTAERSKGAPPSDETAETALDERRQDVRAEVRRAGSVLRHFSHWLTVSTRGLNRATSAWEGWGE